MSSEQSTSQSSFTGAESTVSDKERKLQKGREREIALGRLQQLRDRLADETFKLKEARLQHRWNGLDDEPAEEIGASLQHRQYIEERESQASAYKLKLKVWQACKCSLRQMSYILLVFLIYLDDARIGVKMKFMSPSSHHYIKHRARVQNPRRVTKP